MDFTPRQNRIIPDVPVNAFKTYSFQQRTDLMVRTACEQAGCEAWLNGWRTFADESTDLGKAQAQYIRHGAGRTFKEQRDLGGLTVFTFESRQRCFAEHKTRPQQFLVRRGDWRNMVWAQDAAGTWGWRHDPRNVTRVHQNPDDWVEDFSENQQKVAADKERG